MLCEAILSYKDYKIKTKNMNKDIVLANYQQEPIDVKGRLYSHIKTYTDIPRDSKGNNLFKYILNYTDTADTGSDYLCSICYGMYESTYYILDVLYTKEPMEVTEPATAQMLTNNNVGNALIESNNGGRGFSRNVIRELKALDNNKKQFSSLKPVKPLIDDYDLMASSLSNNLIDFDSPLYAIKGFQGDNLNELQTNLKTKKIIGIGEDGDVDVKTVDVPYQARQAKLELDEKNIYRFGMGLNTAGLKDTSATTNIAIKAAYSLLDLKAKKIEKALRKFLRRIVEIVIDEINKAENKAYKAEDVYFEFAHEIMSNAQENAQIELTEAQVRQTEINTILNVASILNDETIIKAICDWLDIDYEEIKDKLPKNEEENTKETQKVLDNINTDVENGGGADGK